MSDQVSILVGQNRNVDGCLSFFIGKTVFFLLLFICDFISEKPWTVSLRGQSLTFYPAKDCLHGIFGHALPRNKIETRWWTPGWTNLTPGSCKQQEENNETPASWKSSTDVNSLFIFFNKQSSEELSSVQEFARAPSLITRPKVN